MHIAAFETVTPNIAETALPCRLEQASSRLRPLLVLTLLVPLVRREVKSRAGFDPARISPLQSAPGIPCPVFFVHGANDNVIPPEQSALLLEACTAPGTCRTVTGGGHSDALTAGGIQLQAEILKFYFGQTER
mgnify:CR=1 FL=1